MKSFALTWTLKGFVKSKNFNTRKEESLFFKSLKALCWSFPQWKDNSFFRRSMKGFAIYENPSLKISYKSLLDPK